MKALRYTGLVMTALVAGGTIREAASGDRWGLIFGGLAVTIFGIFVYALWDDLPTGKDDTWDDDGV